MLCLTANPVSNTMWEQYAQQGRGFVVEFNCSTLLPNDGANCVLGRVEYTDSPLASFMTDYGLNVFFLKATKWQDEKEWRYLRPLSNCVEDGSDGNGAKLYFLPFQPDAISRVLIKPTCTVRTEIESILGSWGSKPPVQEI